MYSRILFYLLILVGIVVIIGESSLLYQEPPNGTFAFPTWNIAYIREKTSLEESLCRTHSYTGGLILSTKCIGGVNALSHVFFRSHLPRHTYLMQYEERFNEYQMLFRIYYTVKLDFSLILYNWQQWVSFLFSAHVSSIVNKFEGITFRIEDRTTGIPWIEETIPMSFLLTRMQHLIDLSNGETSTTVEIDPFSSIFQANFTFAWDILRDQLVRLEDVYNKPIEIAGTSFVNEELSQVLLSLHLSLKCKMCVNDDLNRVFGNQSVMDSFFHQIQAHIHDFRIQYITSSPGKLIFPHLEPSNGDFSINKQHFLEEVHNNSCYLKDHFPEEAAIIDHIDYRTDFYPHTTVFPQTQHENISTTSYPLVSSKVSSKDLPRILCSIYSTAKSHGTKLAAIKATWGRKCTAFLVFSTLPDPELPAIHVPHLGDEHYGNMWQKIRAVWRYLHKYYLRQFDFFLLGGDDMYYIMENLYAYLDDLSKSHVQEAFHARGGLYLGRSIRYHESNDDDILQSGGAGYLLSQETLSKLFAAKVKAKISHNPNNSHDPTNQEFQEKMVSFFDYHPSCSPLLRTSAEDYRLSQCLRALGVTVFNTSDSVTNHNNETVVKERFHFLAPYHLAHFNATELASSWVTKLPVNPVVPRHLGVSAQSVSFHYMFPRDMYLLDAYLYVCPRRKYNDTVD